jgi:rubrerythrin
MTDDRLDVLKKARAQMAEARFAFAEKLAGSYQRGETENWKEQLLKTQAVIEALDVAIENEETDSSVYDDLAEEE